MPAKGRILTGHRPTGRRHLGHLLGTLETWARLQDDYECFFLIANYHVLTTDYEHPERLRANTREVLLDWLAAGIDPQRSTILLQSAVPEHAELALLLGMMVTVPRLERNPTYKEQLQQLGMAERASLGMLAYPVLQAADILIYRADTVPVGEDQVPHVEVARELARRFNGLYGSTFPEPQALLSRTPRVPGTDGRTMHTSYRNEITLAAPEDEVVRAVQGMITDPARIHPSDPGHPEVCPIFAYHEALQPATAGPVTEACRRGEIGCVSHKDSVARMLVERLEPFRRFHAQMAGHEDDVWDILQRGSLRARAVAQATLSDVRVRMGLTDLMAPEAMPLPSWEGLDLSGKVCC